jgi:glycosyltransferase involved in cell wall biosynthesis
VLSPRFTIITPTYNREDLVQVTINSVINQSFTDWELIIVDDGSTDNTEKVLQKYLTDGRIRYIKKENSGQAHSLNVAAAYATGEFMTFLDSDDHAYPDWLEIANDHIKEDTQIVCVGAIRKLVNGTLIKEGLSELTLSGERIRFKFTCGSLFLRPSVFSAIGGYDAEMKSNIQSDIGYRLLTYVEKTGIKIVAVDKHPVQINVHDGPRIRTNWRKLRDGSIQLLDKHYHFIHKHNRQDISNIYAIIAFSNYKLRQRNASVRYLIKAIRSNPRITMNYLRVFKYAFL